MGSERQRRHIQWANWSFCHKGPFLQDCIEGEKVVSVRQGGITSLFKMLSLPGSPRIARRPDFFGTNYIVYGSDWKRGICSQPLAFSYKVCMEPIDPDKGEARISFWQDLFDHQKHGKSSANNLTTWRSWTSMAFLSGTNQAPALVLSHDSWMFYAVLLGGFHFSSTWELASLYLTFPKLIIQPQVWDSSSRLIKNTQIQ